MEIPKQKYYKLIDQYVDSKKMAWSKSSQKSEKARLRAINPEFLKDPAMLYRHLVATKAPYTIKTTFIRVREFAKWLKLSDIYGDFMRVNARLFKQSLVYKKKKLKIGYQEALERIHSIKDERFRVKALELLATGARWAESFTVDENSSIIGKGNKRRRIFLPISLEASAKPELTHKDYYAFRRALQNVGIKGPHTLRKLAASRLIEVGASYSDVMEIMGWSSIQTAASYVQAKREQDLHNLIEKAFKPAR